MLRLPPQLYCFNGTSRTIFPEVTVVQGRVSGASYSQLRPPHVQPQVSRAQTSFRASDTLDDRKRISNPEGFIFSSQASCISSPVSRITVGIILGVSISLNFPAIAQTEPYESMVSQSSEHISYAFDRHVNSREVHDAGTHLLMVPEECVVATPVSVSTQSTGHFISLPGPYQLINRIVQHLGGGGFAGVVGVSVVYPLDTIKTRMQAQSDKNVKYKDVLDCCTQLLRDEGLGSLYNGLLPQLLGIAPEKALKLTVNEIILEILEQLLPGARLWALELIAGSGGGFSQVLITNPMENVKLRLQVQSKELPPKGLWGVVKEIGLQGLYSGSGITLARDVPSSGIFFACYAFITQVYPEQSFWAGFLAAIPATLLVTPLDVIRTRLQVEPLPGEEPFKDGWHCFRVLLKQEGFRGLFRGGLLRILRTCPQFGITLMIYSLFFDGR